VSLFFFLSEFCLCPLFLLADKRNVQWHFLTKYPQWQFCSNDESLYGGANLDSADELWSSSKNVTFSPIKSVSGCADSPTLRSKPLICASEGVEVKAEYVQPDHSVRLAYKEMNDHASPHLQHSQILKKVEDPVGMSKAGLDNQVSTVNLETICE